LKLPTSNLKLLANTNTLHSFPASLLPRFTPSPLHSFTPSLLPSFTASLLHCFTASPLTNYAIIPQKS